MAVAYFNSAAVSPLTNVAVEMLSYFHQQYYMVAHTEKFLDDLTARLVNVRLSLQRLLNARLADEIVFTRSATEAINLVANGFKWREEDEILITDVEHLANVIPWERAAQKFGLHVRKIPTTVTGMVRESSFLSFLSKKTRVVSLPQVSNIYGGIQEFSDLLTLLRSRGVVSVVDAAQSAGRIPLDVQAIGCDFLVASGRKALMGPLGTGFLYGRYDRLSELEPSMWGTRSVQISPNDRELIRTRPSPLAFEANLPCTAYLLALGSSVDALLHMGLITVRERIQHLTKRLLERLGSVDNIEIFAERDPEKQAGIVCFALHGFKASGVAEFLSKKGLIVGAGSFGVDFLSSRTQHEELLRVSLHFYNTEREIEELVGLVESKAFGD